MIPARRIVLLALLLPLLSGGLAWLVARAMPDGRTFPFEKGDRFETWTVREDADVPFARILAGAGDFKAGDGDGLLMVPRGNVLWVRLTLHNAGDRPRTGVLRQGVPYNDEVSWFYRAGGVWESRRAGEAVRAGPGDLPGREAAFPVTLLARGTETFYLRLRDALGPECDLRWHDQAGYARRLEIATACDGVYFGLLAGLLFYNVFLYLRARQRDLVWYCAYLLSVGAWLLVGTDRTLSLGWPLGSPWREQVFIALLFATAGFIARLARISLELARHAPAWDRRLRVAEGVAVAGAALTLLLGRWCLGEEAFRCALAAGHLLGVTVLAASWCAWRRGVRTGGYFVLALASLFAAIGAGIVIEMTGADASDWRNLTTQTGSVMEMFIFGVAMAERVRRLREEREEAQARALAEAGRSEALQAGFMAELSREVGERTAELTRLNEEKAQVMRLIGHDLRSPLASLDAGIAELRRRLAGPSPELDLAGRLHEQVRYLEGMVRSILEQAGAVRSLPAAGRVTFDPAGFADEVAVLCRPRAERKEQTLLVEPEPAAPGPVTVAGSLGLLRQALVNLVDNAIKFTPRGKTIRIRTRAEEDWLAVEVIDEGPGLQPADYAGLFQAFHPLSARPTEGEPSTGLGLHLVHDIVRRHGGWMKVESMPGQGAVLGFTLPLLPGDA